MGLEVRATPGFRAPGEAEVAQRQRLQRVPRAERRPGHTVQAGRRRGGPRGELVAVTGVGIATALMGTLPTVATVGILAPILFLTLRIVQGQGPADA